MTPDRPRLPRWLIISQVLSLAAIGVLAFLLFRTSATSETYPYIAKRLFTQHPNDTLINFTNLRSSLKSYVDQSPEKIGLYFEYLPTGVSITIGGGTEFYCASLVKLPVVMRTYAFIEQGKLSLDDVLTVEQKQIDRNFGSLWKRGPGIKLTIRELIKFILDDSDNTAFNVLYEKVNVQLLQDQPSGNHASDDVYDFLDIPRAAQGITPMITPKNYTSILKSLFFSAYLSYRDSNEVLKIMTQPHAKNWMRAAIRSDIPVADKIGVYDVEPKNLQVFADCGIIYYPERAYTLCVMVNSPDAQASIGHIQDISRQVFTFIDRQP